METHDRKRFKRLLGDLNFMRRGMVKEFEKVNVTRFGEERARIVRKRMDKDLAMIGHIDPLITALHELLGEGKRTPAKVPKVVVRRVAK